MTISPINLGNTFTNSSGGSVLSGVSSGINTQAIISSLVAAQSAQVTKLQDQVTVNNNQVTALSTLQQILTQFQTAASQLSSPQSPDTNSNVFANTATTITGNTTQAASNFLSATTSANTPPGSYTISNISQLATVSSQVSGTTFTSTTASVVADTATAGEFTAGTYTITGPAGSGTVTLSDTDTLAQVAQDFNNVTSQTGISASVLQTAPGVYKLVFNSTTTGANTAFDLSNGGSPLTVTDGSNNPLSLGDVTFAAPTAGQNAVFDFNGVAITRATNSFSDLISGVSINLLQDTSTQPGASFTLQVAADTSTIETAVQNFASAYNNFITFYAQQTALGSNGVAASSATLYSDSTLRTIYNQLTQQAASIVSGLSSGSGSSTPNQLSDVGLSFGSSPATSTTPAIGNLLFVDTNTLTTEIQNHLSDVENVFGYSIHTSSTSLASFSAPTDTSISAYSLTVDQTASPPTYVATYKDSTGTIQTVNLASTSLGTGGVSLKAPSTSGLAGLLLIYTGSASETINVTSTKGIASQINDFLGKALITNTGLLATDTTALQTSNTTLQTQITNVNTQITNQRTELLQKFSALEAAISTANNSLNMLNAQQQASSSG